MADLDALTPRQREIYQFIRSKIQGRGYGPTVREIGNEFDIKSPNGVMCHLKALQKKGLIHREPNMSRAIQLLDDPTSARAADGHQAARPDRRRPADRGHRAGRENSASTSGKAPTTSSPSRSPGESMIEEHIADGDFVIIQQQEQARDGQIVAVRDDDGEATLKRFFREQNRVRLEPANKTMKPIYPRQRRHPRRPRRRRPEVLRLARSSL